MYQRRGESTLNKSFSKPALTHPAVPSGLKAKSVPFLSLKLYISLEIISVEVPTDYVIETLTKNLEYDNNRRASGEIVTTNCNSVGVQIVNNKPILGSVL